MNHLKTGYLTFLIVALFVCNSNAQSTVTYTTVFKEDFNSNINDWQLVDWPTLHTYISPGKRLICIHPQKNDFAMSLLRMPKSIEKINEGENSTLSFFFQVFEVDSIDNSFAVGLTFDNYDQSKCEGQTAGNFYIIYITGQGGSDSVEARVEERKMCQYSTLVKSIRKAKFIFGRNNKVEIIRHNITYDVVINGTISTSFTYKQKMDLKDLYFQKGTYAFDNFEINKLSYEFASQNGFPQGGDVSSHPKIYMLLAGINTYDNPNYLVGDLEGPVKDITAVKDFYHSINGGAVSNDNIVFLRDKNANSENILHKSAELFSKANINDVIIVYLSGHGGAGYFCAYDQDLQYERLNLIMKTSAARKIFIVDACQAGSWDIKSALASRGRKLSEQEALDLFYDQLTVSGDGINWLLACKPNELSADGKTNGLFTQYMLDGLRGAADSDGDDNNIVTLNELYAYLRARFNKFNADNRGRVWTDTNIPLRMNPVLKSSGDANIPVAVKY